MAYAVREVGFRSADQGLKTQDCQPIKYQAQPSNVLDS